jgi:hypothetical protein
VTIEHLSGTRNEILSVQGTCKKSIQPVQSSFPPQPIQPTQSDQVSHTKNRQPILPKDAIANYQKYANLGPTCYQTNSTRKYSHQRTCCNNISKARAALLGAGPTGKFGRALSFTASSSPAFQARSLCTPKSGGETATEWYRGNASRGRC